MPVGQPTPSTPMYLGRVVTVDPTQRIIDVVLNASGQRIQVMTTPVCARWPMVGETWTIQFINGSPYLGEPYQQYQQGTQPGSSLTGIEEIPAGDAWINSPTGTIHVIGNPNGTTDFTISKSSFTALPRPTWRALPYASGWSDYGSGWQPGQYCLDPVGLVRIRGLVKKSTAYTSEVIAILPVGFRPANGEIGMCLAFDGSYGPLIARISAYPDGRLLMETGANIPIYSPAGVMAWLSFKDYSFIQGG